MANITIENVDLGNVVLDSAEFSDELLAFPGADDYAAGTILARRQVATAVTVTDGTNTGDGTVTAATVVDGPVVPVVGSYSLVCTEAVANGGVFSLSDPSGNLVATGLTMTAGAGAATVFSTAGLQFTITDGDANFIVGDSFALEVAADGDMVVYSATGVGGAQIPTAVLTYPVSASGAGDVAIRALISGKVRQERLVIDAGGSVGSTVLDALRGKGIVPVSVTELNVLDNQ